MTVGLSFQPTLPARGATCSALPATPDPPHFNPRSPHGERREALEGMNKTAQFQPTLPARGATRPRKGSYRPCGISTHAPRTGSDRAAKEALVRAATISTHAPRTGSDTKTGTFPALALVFQPTLPARGATVRRSPCGERHLRQLDAPPEQVATVRRSPCGERQRKVTILSIRIIGFAQKVYHKTVLLRISLAENAVILPEKP